MIECVRKRLPKWAGLLYLFVVVAGLVVFAAVFGVTGVGALETLLGTLVLLLGVPAAVYAMLHPLTKNNGERNRGGRAPPEEGVWRRHTPKVRERRKVERHDPLTDWEERKARSARYRARRQKERELALWVVRLATLVGLGILTSAFTYARRAEPGPAIWQLALYAFVAFMVGLWGSLPVLLTMPEGWGEVADDDDEEIREPPVWWGRPLSATLLIVPALGLIMPSWLGPVGLMGQWLARNVGLL